MDELLRMVVQIGLVWCAGSEAEVRWGTATTS